MHSPLTLAYDWLRVVGIVPGPVRAVDVGLVADVSDVAVLGGVAVLPPLTVGVDVSSVVLADRVVAAVDLRVDERGPVHVREEHLARELVVEPGPKPGRRRIKMKEELNKSNYLTG